jgi:hypothetical protein
MFSHKIIFSINHGIGNMKKITILLLFVSIMTKGNVYFVATDGSDTYSGISLSTPFKTISKAAGIAVAGDVIYLRGGTYAISSTITLSKNGTESMPIRLEGYSGERPLLDFSGTTFGMRGIDLKGNFWQIKSLYIRKAGDNGMLITGAYNTIELCSFSENMDSGMQLSGGAHDNQVLNCDSYWNADPPDYGDADGFACKMDVGTNNYFYGCRAWLNVDDGWDGYLRGADDVSTILVNCWSWMNGYFKDGTDAGANANGNGFKMGGSDDKTLKHNFTLKNCVSFDNKAKGFDQNSNAGSMILYNCSAYRNVGDNYSIYKTLSAGKICTIINCLNYVGKVTLGSFVNQTTNSWMVPFIVTSDDFVTLDTADVSDSRSSTGNLPNLNFLHLNESSDLIDAGTNVGLIYSGSAPDLGAFEHIVTAIEKIDKDYNTLNPYFSGDNLVFNFNRKPEGNTTCKLYNLKGQLAYNTQINADINQITCSGLINGFYILELSQKGRRYVFNIFK